MKSDKILEAIEVAYRRGLIDGNATNDIKPYLITSQVTAHEVANKFCKAHVSGNEAHPKENKKVGEVAVAFAEWIDKNNYETGTLVTKELYEIFKKAKATDR